MSDVHPPSPEGTEGTTNRGVHWHLVLGLAGLHLLFLMLVYLAPVLVGGRNATFTPWARTLHGSLNVAQYELLAAFWAISWCQWQNRTVLALTGSIILSFAHVAVGLPIFGIDFGIDSSLLSTVWDLYVNTVQVFIGHMLVLAIFIDLLRPLWGSLTREIPQEPEQTSIYTILRITMVSAVAVSALQYLGEFAQGTEKILWFCRNTLFETALVTSCIWMVFATRHNWLGLIGLLTTIAVVITFAHPNLLRNGPLRLAIYLIAKTAWICTTFVIVRYFGFRLRKYDAFTARNSAAEKLQASFEP